MYFIQSATSITHQHTFQNRGFGSSIEPLKAGAELILPNLKEFINPRLLRRMSKILRMGCACGKAAINQAEVEHLEAIIIGTGLGCLDDSEKFLSNVLTTPADSLLSPTSFIQSTHNTLAGQLSLLLKNHSYNMTHTQSSLSFEYALQDAVLCLDEGNRNILLGAADEEIDLLERFKSFDAFQNAQLTNGASFFVLDSQKTEQSIAQVSNVKTIGFFEDAEQEVTAYLSESQLSAQDIDLILYTSMNGSELGEEWLKPFNSGVKAMNISDYSGVYMTNSAFGMHWAADIVSHTDNDIKKVLILNALSPQNMGLITVESIEA